MTLWRNQGFIEATPGAVIDYGYILQKIDDLAREFDIQAICFDRWGASRIIQDLSAAGLTVIEMGQGFASMSPPTKEMMKLILEQKIRFPNNPVMRWVREQYRCRARRSRKFEAEQKAQHRKD